MVLASRSRITCCVYVEYVLSIIGGPAIFFDDFQYWINGNIVYDVFSFMCIPVFKFERIHSKPVLEPLNWVVCRDESFKING